MTLKTIKKAVIQELPFFIGVPALIWQVLFFYVPLVFMVLLSMSGFSGKNFIPFFQPVYGTIIARSLLLAVCNAIACACIAYPVAYFIAFKGKRFKNILLFLLIVPFWTNFLLHIFAWFFVLEQSGFLNNFLLYIGAISQPLHLLNSLFAVALMMVYNYLPFMALPIYSSLERLDHRLIEASFDLGATWWQTVRRVLLPVSMSGLQAGFFLVFVPSFGEFVIPELMGGDKTMFVGTVVSQYILGPQTMALGAAFTVLSCGALLSSALLLYWLMQKIIQS